MSQVHCEHCGQPFRVARIEGDPDYFCCAGCALRARVPVDAQGNYPVNAALISALSVGFFYFNQLLDWGLGAVVARQGKTVLAHRFAFGGVILAFAVWIGLVWLERKAGPLRGKDFVVTAVSFGILAASFQSSPPRAEFLALANTLLLAWSFRGVLRPRK